MESAITTMTLEEALDLALSAIDKTISDLLTEAVNTDDREIRASYNKAGLVYALASKRIREYITHNKASQS